MPEKPKTKLLVPIWGERYIERFMHVPLPTLLAPNNLRALAARTDLEVLILTTRGSVPHFEKQAAFAELTTVCNVRFLPIDDLIGGERYGVTLTLAYARGILDSREAQTETHFVLMNADFTLADGSLRTLAEKIAEGHPCILATSLRACSEQVMPILAAQVDRETHQLAVEPRSLVRLALDSLHPMVVGKTVTQNVISCKAADQLYWQVDASTLLGRSHMLFPLAIKPERPLPFPVNSFCDFGFVPELVPSGRLTVLADSDAYFMLELQAAAHEREHLCVGPLGMKGIAKVLSNATTPEHRRFAEYDLVIHADDVPPTLDAIRARATAFIKRLHAIMGRPTSHANNPHWVGNVHYWMMSRAQKRPVPDGVPPELVGASAREANRAGAPNRKRSFDSVLGSLRTALAGTAPFIPPWRYNWTDCRPVRNWMQAMARSTEGRHLLVCGPHSPFLKSAPEMLPVDLLELETLNDGGRWQEWLETHPQVKYRSILCHMIYSAGFGGLRPQLERLAAVLDESATVALFLVDERAASGGGNLEQNLVRHAEALFPPGWQGFQVRASFAGGTAKRQLRRVETRLLDLVWKGRIWQRLLVAAAVSMPWAILSVLTTLLNWRSQNHEDVCPPFCTSIFLTLRRGMSSL